MIFEARGSQCVESLPTFITDAEGPLQKGWALMALPPPLNFS